MKNRISNSRGQAMMAAVMVVGVGAVVFIASIVYRNMSVQKTAVTSRKSLSAFNLAKAALEKGLWTLHSNSGYWKRVSTGGSIPGYSNDVIYTDIPGGSYKINIAQGESSSDVILTASAKDESTVPQYRGLQVTLTKKGAQFGVIMASKIKLQKRTKLHWGPVYAYDSLDLKKKSRLFYPRLFSKGKIKSLDTNSALPNTDGTRWWSFNFKPGVPAWPQIDFEYYKTLAKAQGTYYAKGDRGQGKKHKDDDDDKLDDKDKSDDDDYSYSNIIDTQPYVRFYDTGVKAKFKGGKNLLRGVIISMGSVEFKDGTASISAVNAKYAAAGLPAYYPRAVALPAEAWKEYKKIDTASAGDYPGDIGGPGVSGLSPTYTFGAATNDNLTTKQPIHLEGWVYAAEKLKTHRGGVIVGLLMCPEKTANFGNSDEDKDDDKDKDSDPDTDGDHDRDHHAKYEGDDDNDHHDDEPVGGLGHKTHDDGDEEGHKRRLTLYFQDLDIQLIGAGETRKSWLEVPVTPF